jgi:hypothetical protein
VPVSIYEAGLFLSLLDNDVFDALDADGGFAVDLDRLGGLAIETVSNLANGLNVALLKKLPSIPAERALLGKTRLALLS